MRSSTVRRAVVLLIGCLASTGCQAAGRALGPTTTLPFTSGRGSLVTNEHAFWNADDPARVDSSVWEVTGGSLFSQDGKGWSGRPDALTPDATSANGTGSDVFRLTTKRSDFGDVAVRFDLLNHGLTTTERTPAVDWDGVHVFLRYQSEFRLYYASINRRDGTVTIKKKVPGGNENGGTYYDLAPHKPHRVPYGSWQHVEATVENRSDSSVRIGLAVNGHELVSAVDRGVGGAPITTPGKVGIRGDNCDFLLDRFRTSLLDA